MEDQKSQWPQIGDIGWSCTCWPDTDSQHPAHPPYGEYPIAPSSPDEIRLQKLVFVAEIPGEREWVERYYGKGVDFVPCIDESVAGKPRRMPCDPDSFPAEYVIRGEPLDMVFETRDEALKDSIRSIRKYADSWIKVADALESWLDTSPTLNGDAS